MTVPVRVTNSGSTPEAYFVDARLTRQTSVTLAPQTVANIRLPDYNFTTLPTYLVPSHTRAITGTVTAGAPAFFDFTWPFGDPDLISSAGKTAVRTYSAPQVPDGDWILTPTLLGPFGPKSARSVAASISVTGRTAEFDPAVSSPTGDLWLASIRPSSSFTPYVVDPGQSVTIPVTLTPQAAPGTTVRGTLYLADSSLLPGELTYSILSGNYPEGSDVAAFNYSYTVR